MYYKKGTILIQIKCYLFSHYICWRIQKKEEMKFTHNPTPSEITLSLGYAFLVKAHIQEKLCFGGFFKLENYLHA